MLKADIIKNKFHLGIDLNEVRVHLEEYREISRENNSWKKQSIQIP